MSKARIMLNYVLAAAISMVAVAVVAGFQHFVGWVPMLFLPAIVLVEAEWGVGPAGLSTILCTLGSLRLMGQDGDISLKIHIWANLLLLPGIAGSLIYLMEMRRKHKRMEHERGVELSILLQSMPEAVLIFGTSGRVVESNRAAQALVSLRSEQLHGMHVRELARLLEAQRDEDLITYENLVVTRALRGEAVPYEPRTLHNPADGSPMQTVLSAHPMRDDEGNLSGAVLVIRDITEVTELQTRVAATERHMAIGQMAAGIAHDFNNVLDTISQATAVMEMHRPSADTVTYLRMIQNAVRRGAEIINRVREYIRGGSGEPTAVDPKQIIEEALELSSPLWREMPKLDIKRELEPVGKVLANPADLRRVFTNLIINSMQAMPQGGQIVLRCHEQNGHKVVCTVSDNGPGIPANMQKKIFLPYFTTKSRGTGLGLSGAQRIMQSIGGSISFVSEPGKGTTFTVEMPRMTDAQQQKVTPQKAA